MIYILSENTDLTTDLVSEWIRDNKSQFIRYNDSSYIKSNSFINKDLIGNVWIRRGFPNFIPNIIKENYANKIFFSSYIINEIQTYIIYLEYKLRQCKGIKMIGSYKNEILENNKLINLEIAKKIGFIIPPSIVTNNKEELKVFFNNHNKKIITKDLKVPVNILLKNKVFQSTGVKMITEKMLDKLNEDFAPIYAQSYIEKKYEVRVFVFCDKLYPMAIFSQNDKQTTIDYRNYNDAKPNRCIPMVLPSEIEKKIFDFMKQTDMNTGSIDFIVTKNNEFYFLEINPMGQFHWVSSNCNYHIEKDIANHLCYA